MGAVQHVFKRGSVYWWRRRLPNGTESRALVLIELSLRTKSLEQAKLIAAEVTLASEHLLQGARRKMIDPDDAKKILIKVALKHSAKLDMVAAAEIAYGEDVESSRQFDVVCGWACRLFAAHGEGASIGLHEERELRAAGLDMATIGEVSRQLIQYREGGAMPPRREKIEALMEEFGVPETRVNFQQAQQLYLRGMSAALLDTRRRWSGVRPDDDALLQSALVADASQAPLPYLPETTTDKRLNPAAVLVAPTFQQPSDDQGDEFEMEDDGEEDDEVEYNGRGLIEIITKVAHEKVALNEWGEKMPRQHISIAKLFVKFVGHDNPTRMRQSHIGDFRSMLLELPKNHGKSSRDEERTLAEILARAKDLPASERGLSPATINRYMTQMNNIVTICKSAGFPFGDFEGVSGLRVKKRGNERNERGKFTDDDLTAIFSLPVWTGSIGEGKRLASGTLVIHDAMYWMPLLAPYSGGRREEIAGLLLEEIELDAETPNIRIEDNSVRKIKNEESKRRVPLHPELLRLGFDNYVNALRELGHVLLFPELRAAAPATPMGDVFDDDWREIKKMALPNAEVEKKVFHSFRHWCVNEMKQAEVQEEIRKDIVGHKGNGVHGARYSDAARLHVMAKALATLPQPSCHIEPRPIELLASVVSHRPPPTKAKGLR